MRTSSPFRPYRRYRPFELSRAPFATPREASRFARLFSSFHFPQTSRFNAFRFDSSLFVESFYAIFRSPQTFRR